MSGQTEVLIDAGGVARAMRRHGIANFAFAALYAWLGWVVAPGRGLAWNFALALAVGGLVLAGALLVVGHRSARLVALTVQGYLLVFAATVIALLVASAAYLHGIYGGLGRGLATVAILVAALVVELVGWLPYVQLRFLLREDVRAAQAHRHTVAR